jgi:hypothetical protein
LGGVALSVMATGAQADELADLKAQLEALQGRVNQLEQQPATMALPEGTSLISVSRGSGDNDAWRLSRVKDDIPSDRGFTIAVTPTADIPAPVAEVVVYGYVKGDVIFDFDKDVGDSFYVPNIWSLSGRNDQHVRLHARQSRFGIRSKVDTAIGQIRTLIEGDFFSSGNVFRLRHAWGEWDMTPYWTFGAGQYWQTAALLPLGITTVDFSGDAGPLGYTRRAQVRLTYHNGPISWAIAAERPTFNSSAEWPNFSSYFQYDAAGGHQFIITGTVSDYDNDNPDSGPNLDVGWAVQAGANINLGDIATFTFGGIYGQGEACRYLNQSLLWCDITDADKGGATDFVGDDDAYGVFAGVSFNVNDTTSINLGGGWSHLDNGFSGARAETIKAVDVFTAHGNVLWQPVKQMRLGWELMWGQYDWDAGAGFNGAAKRKDDAIRAQFGAWFFF